MNDKGDISDIITVVFSQEHINSKNYKMNLKTELKSFFITFVVGVSMTLLASWGDITLETFKDGTIFAVFFGALRAGVKNILEMVIVKFSSK